MNKSLQESLKPRPGGPALLFERLTDLEPRTAQERVPLRTHDRDALFASIEKELGLLLDTRAPQLIEDWRAMEKTVLCYGLPDTAHLSTARGADRDMLKQLIEEAIAAFEPRLTNVHVSPLPARQGRFRFVLSAGVVIADMVEPISFPLEMR